MSRASLETLLAESRAERSWSQAELARRAGISRAEVSAIETGRVVPSTAAALALAAALGSRVEELFRLTSPPAEWTEAPVREPALAWRVRIGGAERLVPAERTALGVLPADARVSAGTLEPLADARPERALLLAGCDPAVGLLASALGGRRVLALVRSSRRALELIAAGGAHAAGVHLNDGDPEGNERAVREIVGGGCRLVTVARWELGVALAPGSSPMRGDLRAETVAWVGREAGSGARRVLEAVLGTRRAASLRHVARDHAGVAAAITSGFAQAGPCVRLVAEQAGLDFVPVHTERYELCFRREDEEDPRLVALVEALRSRGLRREIAALPGYDATPCGELRDVGDQGSAA